MDLGLERLIDGQRIEAIQAGIVPFPAHARNPGDHLFVNCHYSVGMADKPLDELYQQAKEDALLIMRHVAQNAAIRKHIGVAVQVYGHYPVPGAARRARRRIYGVSILCRNLPANCDLICSENLGQLNAYEESQLSDIGEVRQHIVGIAGAAE